MGDLTVYPLAYDTIADKHGEDVAQRLWEKNGFTGKYVPGFMAVGGYTVHDCAVEGFDEHKADKQRLAESMSPLGQEVFGLAVDLMKGTQL